ncbi:MAG: ABC transporter permease subunit, partial [Geminicoccaceae bacterium]
MRRHRAALTGALLLAVLLVLPLAGLDAYWTYILAIGFYYAILSASWSLLVGYVGRISFAHAAFAGLGAYATAVGSAVLGWPIALTIFLGVVVAALVGVVIGRLCLELHGAYLG